MIKREKRGRGRGEIDKGTRKSLIKWKGKRGGGQGDKED